MNKLRFSRRNLIKGAGLGAATQFMLPELHDLAYAQEAVPKMFLMFYSHHGTLKNEWGSGTDSSVSLGNVMKPLEPYKNDIVLVSGLHMKSADLYKGNNNAGHIQGQVHSLTSTKPLSPVTNEGSRPVAGGPSIDQAILDLLKAKNGGNQLTDVDSLQVGIANAAPGSDQMMGRAGYRRLGTSIRPMGYFNDPNLAWGSLFTGFNPGGGTPTVPGKEDPARVQRRLMAQFASGQFKSTADKVKNLYGESSYQRFSAHADFAAALEKSLEEVQAGTGGGTGTGGGGKVVSAEGCQVPERASVPNKPAMNWVDVLSDNMPKIAHLALACGRTRFATVYIEATVEPDAGLHGWIHDGNLTLTRPYYVKVAEQVAKTLKLLKETPTADGKNMLYHTVFLWAGELGDGKGHSWDDVNWVVGGQAGGALQTGRFVNAAGRSTADLFVSLGKLMDSGMTTFGDPAAFSAPLQAIKA